jgi:hypothetical protein
LAAVQKAFRESQPEALQQAQNKDLLARSPDEAWQEGLGQLEGMIDRLQKGTPHPGEDQRQQARRAFDSLSAALANAAGEQGDAGELSHELEKALLNDQFDPAVLKALLSRLARFNQELVARMGQNGRMPDLLHLDLTKVAPEYRSQVEAYFRELSEK